VLLSFSRSHNQPYSKSLLQPVDNVYHNPHVKILVEINDFRGHRQPLYAEDCRCSSSSQDQGIRGRVRAQASGYPHGADTSSSLDESVVAVFTDPFARAGGPARPFAALHAFSHGDAENSSSHSDLGDF
jgi:hypothetical protein